MAVSILEHTFLWSGILCKSSPITYFILECQKNGIVLVLNDCPCLSRNGQGDSPKEDAKKTLDDTAGKSIHDS